MRRRCTPASSRGVAPAWRNGCPEARWWMPLACRAARQASCTLWRGMGVVAVDIATPLRPGAGTSHTGLRGVCQDWRSPSRGWWGSGPERSLAPVPQRTWPSMRALSMAGICRGVPSCRRRPQASRVLRQARYRGNRPHWRMVRPAARLRMTGSLCSCGGLTKVRVVHARLRVYSEKNWIPQRAMVLALREECWTCVRERKESRSASSVIGSGDLWSCAARWRTARTYISWVRSDRPRSGRSSIRRWRSGVRAIPPVREG